MSRHCLVGARAAILLAGLLSASAAGPASGATVHGTVKGKARAPAATPSSGDAAYTDRSLRYAALVDYEHLHPLVVYAEPVGAAKRQKSPPSLALLLSRIGRRLTVAPEFAAAAEGTVLAMINDTDEALTIYAAGDSAGPFEMELPPRGQGSAAPAAAGLYHLRCLQDPAFRCEVLAAGRYSALADAQGAYRMELPPGVYDLTAWHPRLPPQTRRVKIGPGESPAVDFVLSVKQLPEVP
jgi:hypothetical protein